jgi:hypothetical protein
MQLSQCHWYNLSGLNLSNSKIIEGDNKVGDTGCKWLSQSPWKHLNNLSLCKSFLNR